MSSQLKGLGQGVAIAEEQRDKRVLGGFIADLFRGKTSFEKLFPWPDISLSGEYQERVSLLLKDLDLAEINRTGEVPEDVLRTMANQGFFALKLPKEWGGLGLSQSSYVRVVELLTSAGGPLSILVSADNTIGCKFPIVNFGTPEQKAKYLPELAKWPSGFCFTEQEVGSDPARMQTYALRVEEEGGVVGYILNGQKWYTTNAPWKDGKPLAQYLLVIAKIVNHPEEVKDAKCFGAFIVPTNAQGVTIGSRNEFCGMRGIYNSDPRFDQVRVAKNQLIGQEGQGFRIALQALNTGRIAIGGSCLALAKQAHLMSRWWARKRHQWGGPIGEKELIGSGKLVPGAANILAMEALVKLAAWRFDQGLDPRLEAAACKVFASEEMWQIVDNCMQIFGGRGYETQASLAKREPALPVERIFRDARPNRIFEGSTEILSQWLVREGLDEDLNRGGVFLEKGQRIKKAWAIVQFLGAYFKTFVFGRTRVSLCVAPPLQKHVKFVKSWTPRFRRQIILLSAVYQEKLKFKQLTIDRLFRIAIYLTAMTAVCSYATHLHRSKGTADAVDLADVFCAQTRRKIERCFSDLWDNDDVLRRGVSKKLLAGHYDAILEEGVIPAVAKIEN